MNGGGNKKICLDELELFRAYAKDFGKETQYYFYIFLKTALLMACCRQCSVER